MITKDQAIALGDRTLRGTIHTEFNSPCRVTVGPRGGVKRDIQEVRVSGKCRTLVREPEYFRLPVKYGLRNSLSITNHNAHMFHLATDCPAMRKENG